MLDQASELRKLASRSETAAGCAKPTCVLVCGAESGVGATTTAVLLAECLAQHAPTILLDAGSGCDAAIRCGAAPTTSALTDVLAARKELDEILQPTRQSRQLRVAPGGGLSLEQRGAARQSGELLSSLAPADRRAC